jgi:hypothetical protein
MNLPNQSPERAVKERAITSPLHVTANLRHHLRRLLTHREPRRLEASAILGS